MEIIITDLTRFSKPDIVCIAGINNETGECIRPLPYISLSDCQKLNILPGSKLDGTFIKDNNVTKPHTEDRTRKDLKYIGDSSSDEFQAILESSLSSNISEGFDYIFSEKGKVIPSEFKPVKSIITLKVSTQNIEIVKDSFKEGKIRLHLLDNEGTRFSFLSITDLGFYNYAMKYYHDTNFPNIINDFIRKQDIVYLRIGLGREYQGGYWLQVNGIYTFPNYNTEIRSYS